MREHLEKEIKEDAENENKTNPTATSFQQSFKLIQAGTPTDNADFAWVTTDAVPLESILELKESAQKRYNQPNWKFTSAWSLSKLIDLLRNDITVLEDDEETLSDSTQYLLRIDQHSVSYVTIDGKDIHTPNFAPNLMDAIVKMEMWLAKEGWYE